MTSHRDQPTPILVALDLAGNQSANTPAGSTAVRRPLSTRRRFSSPASSPSNSSRIDLDIVARDVERLLNTRPRFVNPLPENALNQSNLTYGLLDPLGLSGTTADQLEQLTQLIATAIARFEPRIIVENITEVIGRGDFQAQFELAVHAVGATDERRTWQLSLDPLSRQCRIRG